MNQRSTAFFVTAPHRCHPGQHQNVLKQVKLFELDLGSTLNLYASKVVCLFFFTGMILLSLGLIVIYQAGYLFSAVSIATAHLIPPLEQ